MDELARGHTVAMAVLRDMIVRLLRGAWEGMPAFNEADVARWLSEAVPIVDAGQRQAASLTDAYLARAMERQPLGIDPALVIGAAVRSGTTPEEEWRRPFVTLWSALRRGVAYEQAVAAAWERADAMAQLDVQLSMRATAREVALRDDGIYGWRRVTDGNACELCQIASTQRYHRGDLLPIHARCGCTVAPLTSPSDQIVNRQLYGELKASRAIDSITYQRGASRAMQRARASRARADELLAEARAEPDPDRADRLQDRAVSWGQRARQQERLAGDWRAHRVRAAVRRHGELGPVLVNARDNFTSAAELAV